MSNEFPRPMKYESPLHVAITLLLAIAADLYYWIVRGDARSILRAFSTALIIALVAVFLLEWRPRAVLTAVLMYLAGHAIWATVSAWM